MPAPKRPNVDAAAAVRRRIGDEKCAARLRDHGWLVVPPERVAQLPEDVINRITEEAWS
jgi:hypothetical protein